jgi:hypothetical protein
LSQVGGSGAHRVLERAAREEKDGPVLGEIRVALDPL